MTLTLPVAVLILLLVACAPQGGEPTLVPAASPELLPTTLVPATKTAGP